MSDLEFLMYEDFILGAISAEEYAEFLKIKNRKPYSRRPLEVCFSEHRPADSTKK